MFDAILVRYDEIGVKGKNRGWFEDILEKNIRKNIVDKGYVSKFRGRLVVKAKNGTPIEELLERLKNIPGISTFSPAFSLPLDASWEDMAEKAIILAEKSIEEGKTVFRVSCNRANKKYPMKSPEIQKLLSTYVLKAVGENLTVSMKDYNFCLEIEIDRNDIFIFKDRVTGVKGMPVDSSGHFLSLLSGGIDSPVASYLCMKRGARVSFLSFFSPPYMGEESITKLKDLAEKLKDFQGTGYKLYIVPFIDIQLLIRARCFESYRTVIFRRMMFRIAEKIALRDNYSALVTGEALSQVASQTIENLTIINDSVESLPVIRPLITYEKQESINLAQQIGTYEISIRPSPDSCIVFLPEAPVIKGKRKIVEQEEARLDPEIKELIEKAIENVQTIEF